MRPRRRLDPGGGLLGVLGNVTSIGAGALILGFGLLLPLILILRGKHGSQPSPHRKLSG